MNKYYTFRSRVLDPFALRQRITVVTLTLVVAGAMGMAIPVAAGDLTTGASTTIADVISSTVFDPLSSCTFALPVGPTHVCTATCSAETARPPGVNNKYILGLGLDGNYKAGCIRSFEHNENAGVNDPNVLEVTTTCTFTEVAAGGHTLSCAAAKETAAVANMTVNDSSITCHCGHSTHQ